MSDNLPDNGGYVAAAYLVFLALVLVYVVILGIRLSRLQGELAELDDLAGSEQPGAAAAPPSERTPA
ncbi:hypothetical protein [Conexibacter sp. SYSU D00693]|uniref:hypothetical protein n=1 Tax=Conexibacter sp. SYSU D00693 TaxID=2812560 RepID=UPI00196B0F5C|nr:hypothetical protein [Conexibacter sp. SYSU D00693]